MKCHLIVGVLIILTLILDGTFAGRRRGSFNIGRSNSLPRSSANHPDANRRAPSSEVKPFSYQRSRFRSVSPAASTRPVTPAPSSPSRFQRLRLSPVSRAASSSVTQLGDFAKPIRPEGSKTRIENRHSTFRNTANRDRIEQSKSIHQTFTDRASRPVKIVRSRSENDAQRPTLQQLKNTGLSRRASTPARKPPSPVQNPQTTPSPVTATQDSAPAQVANPEPGSQPPAPAALIQAGAAPAPGSRAALKAAKAQAKQNRINKSQANAQATLQQINNANIGTCKDPTAPASACFDFYVLAVSWGPTMKIKQLGTEAPINKPEWAVHGLWPSLKTYNRLPKQCNLAIPYDPKEILSIQDALEDKWFSLNGSPKDNQAFWQHEWEKHGTCATRSPLIKSVKQYFKKGLELFNQANVQAKLTAANFRARTEMTNRDMHDEISRILGHRVTLEPAEHPRTNEFWLSEIRLCYDFNFHLMNCPPDIKTLNTENENIKMIYSL